MKSKKIVKNSKSRQNQSRKYTFNGGSNSLVFGFDNSSVSDVSDVSDVASVASVAGLIEFNIKSIYIDKINK